MGAAFDSREAGGSGEVNDARCLPAEASAAGSPPRRRRTRSPESGWIMVALPSAGELELDRC
jgi:hypothetical protein